jgi:sugar/nucleoside kinase (ribokinase family)
VLFANDDELAAVDGPSAVLRRCGALVVKHGPAGSSWTSTEGTWSTPALPARVVDTVGAGDALDAGVIDAVLRGCGPQEAIDAGARAAARAVAAPSARPLTAS